MNDLEKEFVPYELALEMKALGFNEPCFGYWFLDVGNESMITYPQIRFSRFYTGKEILAPLYQQAFRWFREKHNLYGIIIPTVTMAWTFKTMTVVIGMVEVPPYSHVDAYDYSSREEAELECLKKLIELVKNK